LSIEGIFIAPELRERVFLRMQDAFTRDQIANQATAVAMAFTLCAHDSKQGQELTVTQICAQTQQTYQLVIRSFDLSINDSDLAAAFENNWLCR